MEKQDCLGHNLIHRRQYVLPHKEFMQYATPGKTWPHCFWPTAVPEYIMPSLD